MRTRIVATLLGSASILLATSASAQDSGGQPVELPALDVTAEATKSTKSKDKGPRKRSTPAASAGNLDQSVVVSGEKVERGVFDTASSVVVLTAEEIENKVNVESVSKALEGTPNVVYPGTVAAPVIRGQDTQGPNFGSTAFFGGTIPRGTVNVDGHYLNYYESVYGATQIWDAESIELFRGPQTTSQGANAIAGAIIVNTKDPTFRPEGAAQVELGSFGMKRSALALSGPISDQLAARIAVDYYARDSIIDYINPAFNGQPDQDPQTFNGRVKLLYRPDQLPGFEAKLTYSANKTNRPTTEAASVPYDELENLTATNPVWKSRTDSVVSDIKYNFGNGVEFFNQTQYSALHTDRLAIPVAVGSATIDQDNILNETRLTFGNERSVFSGVTGLFLSRTTSNDLLNQGGVSKYDDTKESVGLYSELSYRLTDHWTLTGGLRYQRDHIQRSGTSSAAFGAKVLDYDQTFEAWLPKAVLAYDLTSNIKVGALVSKGYTPGGVNLRFETGNYVTFDPETVWNYELFGRARLLGDKLHLTGNLFYSDLKDAQRLLPDYFYGTLFGATAFNAEKARSYGAEIGVDYKVRNDLRLRAGAGLLHTELIEFTAPGGSNLEGNEFGFAPSYTLSFGVDWDITPRLTLSADVRHTDDYYSTDENYAAYQIGAYTVANSRITYLANDNVKLFAYANNIFDERVPLFKFDDRSSARAGIVGSMLEPRTFGVGTRLDF